MAESEQGTDWRVDKDGEVHNGRNRCRYGWPGHPDCTPVLVVPVGEARETIARAIYEAEYRFPREWEWEDLHRDALDRYGRRADAVLAALAPVSEGGRGDG